MKWNYKRSSLFRHGNLNPDVMLINAIKTVEKQQTISDGVPCSGMKKRAIINNVVVALADVKHEEEKV